MGLHFRGSGYSRFVRFGKRTVKSGECMQYWDVYGRCTTTVGPKLVYLWRSYIRFCSQHTAGVNEYLKIKNRDGTQQNIPGPVSLYFDHIKHAEITTCEALPIAANEAIVVYKEVLAEPVQINVKTKMSEEKVPLYQKSGSTMDSLHLVYSRKILHGPLMYQPRITETVMEHVWHGESKANHPSEVRVLSGLRKLQKIPLLEQQLYYNVRDVKTSDNNSLTIKLMLCYKIDNLEQMLDATNDPVGDLVNATCADVVAWAASRSYTKTLQETGSLSDLKTFPRLIEACKRIGLTVGKVVYRGYKGSIAMEKMHDIAVKRRLELKAQKDAAEEKERLEDFKLSKGLQRAAQEREKTLQENKHQANLKEMWHDQKLKQKHELNDLEHKQKLKQIRELNDLEAAHLKVLKDSGVDLTKYLVAKATGPATSHLHMSGNETSQLHVHG